MAILDPNAAKNLKPWINGFWTVLLICLVVTLGCEYVLKTWPPYLEWLRWASDFIIVLGLIGIGGLVASRNPLVK